MRPSLFFLFFLFAFIVSSAKGQFVVDIRGNNVINGGRYYIRPYIWAFGGGLRLAKTGNETCPLSVVQSPAEIDNGLPWTIRSPLKIRFIPTNAIVNFLSVKGKVPSCVPLPSKWTVVEGEGGIKYVKIRGGFKNTLKGWFKIQKYNSKAYKIVFCPINGDSCKEIGISSNRRLVITDDHTNFGFVFVKAESSEVSEQVINNLLEA